MTQDQTISALKASLLKALLAAYPQVDIKEVEISVPTDRKKADFVSNIGFQLSKEIGKSPFSIAEDISRAFEGTSSDFSIEVAHPGFINFRANDRVLISTIKLIIQENDLFGKGHTLDGQIWVIEHTSPNPNKAMHVGHLRNNLIGMSLANTLEFSGAKVIRDWVDNNRGIAIAKAMWGYLVLQKKESEINKSDDPYELLNLWFENPDDWHRPNELGVKADQFVGECYMAGSEMYKSNDIAREATRKLALRWEQGDNKVWKLWEQVISYAHEGIFETLDRIGNHWDNGWHEHEHYKQGKDLVAAGLGKGIFTKLDDGAIITNLESYNLPDTVVLKSDGTSLYITQDIALTKLKKETYKADKLMWVIGPEQTTAMKQVFAVCEQLGIGSYDDYIHVPYGLVTINKDGSRKKMSSRGGEALLIDTLLDTVRDAVLTKDRGYTPEQADRIAVAAVKFAILKPSRNTDAVVDIETMINLEGDSGVYILYTMARARALLSKVPLDADMEHIEWKFNEIEHSLIVNLSYFPGVVRNAAVGYSPNLLVDYMIDIARSFNAMYARERFLTEDREGTQRKLRITAATLVVLENSTRLLGMPHVEEI